MSKYSMVECDRCHFSYREGRSPANRVKAVSFPAEGGKTQYADLCNDCRFDLIRWIQEGKA